MTQVENYTPHEMNHRENAGILCHTPVRPATWERSGRIAGQGRPQVKQCEILSEK
jgi:hypothetical protein